MDDSSFKALNIVINENSNNFINEWRNKSILWKNISKMLLNPNSMLSKIGSIIRLEQSYNLNECVLDKECLEFHIGNCKAPCVGKQQESSYHEEISEIKDILNGNLNGFSPLT